MGTLIEPMIWNRVPLRRREAAFNEVDDIFIHLYPEVIQEAGSKEGVDLWILMQELRARLQLSIPDDSED